MHFFLGDLVNISNMTKRLDIIRLRFLRDAHQGGLDEMNYVPSSEMLVCMFTKPIKNTQFLKLVSAVMRCPTQ
jgi:hypothetical protein